MELLANRKETQTLEAPDCPGIEDDWLMNWYPELAGDTCPLHPFSQPNSPLRERGVDDKVSDGVKRKQKGTLQI